LRYLKRFGLKTVQDAHSDQFVYIRR